MKGIENGNIVVDGVKKNSSEARYFDANTIVPNNSAAFSSQQLRVQRQNLLGALNGFKVYVETDIYTHCTALIAQIQEIYPELVQLRVDRLYILTNAFEKLAAQSSEKYLRASSLIAQLRSRYQQLVLSGLGGYQISQKLIKYADSIDEMLVGLKNSDLENEAIDLWGETTAFQQNLGQAFVAYRDMHLFNRLKINKNREEPSTRASTLTDKEFTEKIGEAPWTLINRIFSEAGLPFSVEVPDMFFYEDITVTLRKIGIAQSIPFTSLSSGEKVLMSFALCLYEARDGRQVIHYPELLLFDEIDAPLHPVMVKSILETIQRELVVSRGIKVILTTHSPSTVALAPTESLYAMSESKFINKISKDAALRLLTVGIPTMSISLDSRRQVFVESRSDANLFDKIFTLVRHQIPSDGSLQFIPVSAASKNKKNGGEEGGCDAVKSMVRHLTKAGCTSIFGLIDWDSKNSANQNIVVLAEGYRYAIENCLLDPCLVGLLIIKDDVVCAHRLGLLKSTENYISLTNSPPERLQVLADAVSAALGLSGPTVDCHYLGGTKIVLHVEALRCSGHDLANKIFEKFPFLRAKSRTDAALMHGVVDQVLAENLHLVPIEFCKSFQDLLDYPILTLADSTETER